MKRLGSPIKIRGLTRKSGVSNENLGVSSEILGSQMKIWVSPMKRLRSSVKIWGSPSKIWGVKAETAHLGKWPVYIRQKPSITPNERFLKARNRQ